MWGRMMGCWCIVNFKLWDKKFQCRIFRYCPVFYKDRLNSRKKGIVGVPAEILIGIVSNEKSELLDHDQTYLKLCMNFGSCISLSIPLFTKLSPYFRLRTIGVFFSTFYMA